MVEKKEPRRKKVAWIDGEAGFRGGSKYQVYYHNWLKSKGICSRYMNQRSGSGLTVEKLRLIASTYLGQELRGTIPRELPILLLCKRRLCFVQSPAEEWSWLSQLGLKVIARVAPSSLVAVSRSAAASVRRITGLKEVRVEYAKVPREIDKPIGHIECGEVIVIIMDGGDVDKGALRHKNLISEIGKKVRVTAEIYGKGGSIRLDTLCSCKYNGYVKDPFRDARERHPGKALVFLGCSRYEGLHMAIIEAGKEYIPSIMSNIPAHREIQEICGEKLLIGNTLDDDLRNLEMTIEARNYERYARRYRRMFLRFWYKSEECCDS